MFEMIFFSYNYRNEIYLKYIKILTPRYIQERTVLYQMTNQKLKTHQRMGNICHISEMVCISKSNVWLKMSPVSYPYILKTTSYKPNVCFFHKNALYGQHWFLCKHCSPCMSEHELNRNMQNNNSTFVKFTHFSKFEKKSTNKGYNWGFIEKKNFVSFIYHDLITSITYYSFLFYLTCNVNTYIV